MSIQANVNQMLSLAGMAARLAPGAERKAEIYQTKQNLDRADTAFFKAMVEHEKVLETNEVGSFKEEAAGALVNETEETVANLQRKLFELDPSTQNAKMAARAEGRLQAIEKAKTERERLLGSTPEEALVKEQSRIASSNEVVRGLDLDKLAEGPRARVERAYKRAEKDTHYLNKKEENK